MSLKNYSAAAAGDILTAAYRVFYWAGLPILAAVSAGSGLPVAVSGAFILLWAALLINPTIDWLLGSGKCRSKPDRWEPTRLLTIAAMALASIAAAWYVAMTPDWIAFRPLVVVGALWTSMFAVLAIVQFRMTQSRRE